MLLSHSDPAYDQDDVTYSSKLYGIKPLRSYDFVSSNPKKVNIVEKARVGGVVAILHQLFYKNLPGCVRIRVLRITAGPNMRIRALTAFVRFE